MVGKIQQIICTGNVCDKETHEYLRSIAPEIHVVRGDYDEVRLSFPSSLLLPSLLFLTHPNSFTSTFSSLGAAEHPLPPLPHSPSSSFPSNRRDRRSTGDPSSGSPLSRFPRSADGRRCACFWRDSSVRELRERRKVLHQPWERNGSLDGDGRWRRVSSRFVCF